MTTRRTAPDPAEALADHLLTDGVSGGVLLRLVAYDGLELKDWSREQLLRAIRKAFPPQKPKRKKK